MRNLLDLRVESLDDGPELEELFRLTRPDKKQSRMERKLPTAGVHLTPPPVKHPAPVATRAVPARYPRKVAP